MNHCVLTRSDANCSVNYSNGLFQEILLSRKARRLCGAWRWNMARKRLHSSIALPVVRLFSLCISFHCSICAIQHAPGSDEAGVKHQNNFSSGIVNEWNGFVANVMSLRFFSVKFMWVVFEVRSSLRRSRGYCISGLALTSGRSL